MSTPAPSALAAAAAISAPLAARSAPPTQHGELLTGGDRSPLVSRQVTDHTTITQTTRTPGGPNTGALQAQKGCDVWKTLKIAAVILAVVALVAGVVGLLVYLGQLNISWTGLGAMTKEIGLYTMLAGFGLTTIIGVLLGVNACLEGARNRSADPSAQGRGWLSCLNSKGRQVSGPLGGAPGTPEGSGSQTDTR